MRFEERRLLRHGTTVPLGARAFDVLAVLLLHHDRVVSKEELLDFAWPGLVVEEANVQVQISAVRKVLGHDSVTTVPGIGYRFTAPLNPIARHIPPHARATPTELSCRSSATR